MTVTDIVSQLKRDEGEVLEVYLDSKGIRTAGVGHNLQAHDLDWPVGTPITQEQSDLWLNSDIANAKMDLAAKLPWVMYLDPVRQGVLINMCFNIGVNALLGFHHTLTLVQSGDYSGAASAMLQSLWARQVGPRATRLANQMSTGIWT